LKRPEDRRLWGGDSDGRDPDLVPRLEAVFGLDPAAVDPHLAAAQDPIDVALRYPFEDAQQEVIYALPDPFFAYFKPGRASLA
jgi:hypothetical protein